jgi:hypothetical protein
MVRRKIHLRYVPIVVARGTEIGRVTPRFFAQLNDIRARAMTYAMSISDDSDDEDFNSIIGLNLPARTNEDFVMGEEGITALHKGTLTISSFLSTLTALFELRRPLKGMCSRLGPTLGMAGPWCSRRDNTQPWIGCWRLTITSPPPHLTTDSYKPVNIPFPTNYRQ